MCGFVLWWCVLPWVDDELIYLDPHTTQQAVESESGIAVDDQSYHCQRTPHRMKITSLDPSVALVRPFLTCSRFEGHV